MAQVNGFDPGSFETEWVKTGVANKEFIYYAENMGKHLALLNKNRNDWEYNQKRQNNNLSTSQIRNFFGSLKTIEMKGFKSNKEKFYMLKPLLAYAYKRDGKEAFRDFKEEVIDKSLNIIMQESDDKKQEEYFKNFCQIFEAILAYHRAHGGK